MRARGALCRAVGGGLGVPWVGGVSGRGEWLSWVINCEARNGAVRCWGVRAAPCEWVEERVGTACAMGSRSGGRGCKRLRFAGGGCEAAGGVLAGSVWLWRVGVGLCTNTRLPDRFLLPVHSFAHPFPFPVRRITESPTLALPTPETSRCCLACGGWAAPGAATPRSLRTARHATGTSRYLSCSGLRTRGCLPTGGRCTSGCRTRPMGQGHGLAWSSGLGRWRRDRAKSDGRSGSDAQAGGSQPHFGNWHTRS